jgi:glucose uptake protein GlcU
MMKRVYLPSLFFVFGFIASQLLVGGISIASVDGKNKDALINDPDFSQAVKAIVANCVTEVGFGGETVPHVHKLRC